MTLSRSTRTKALGLLALAAPVVGLTGCGDLSVDPYSQIPADQFFRTEEEVLAALAPVYANLRNLLTNNGYHGISQVMSDETIVPTRGTDWGDGGAWLQLHRQTWGSSHPFVNDTWNVANTGIARANGVLANLETATIPNKEAVTAETRALRAYYYYVLLDLFGRAPIVGDEPGEFLPDANDPPPAAKRSELFAFVESEFVAARVGLPATQAQRGRMGQDTIDAILANMYLNAQVFSGEVTASGLQRGTAQWQKAFDKADGLIRSGRYTLVSNWASVFSPGNENNQEHIFTIQHQAVAGLGVSFINRSLHYNSTNVGAWNGFSAIAETYNSFNPTDPRRRGFAVGPQVNFNTGAPINDRQGNRLNFTLTFDKRTNPAVQDIEDAIDYAGARFIKFPADPAEVGGNHGNDYPLFRLGEMYLIRAEAAFELGNTAQALTDINAIRARVGVAPRTTLTRETILLERLYEMNYEMRRRQDLIRANESTPSTDVSTPRGAGNLFTRARPFKPQTEPFRVVLPIPQNQINANPALTQNAGY